MTILEVDPKSVLIPNALRDRDPGHIEKLIWSIQHHGQEEAARAYKDEKGKLVLINGHSRREACDKLGIKLRVTVEEKPDDLASYLITDHSRKNPDMGARFSEHVSKMYAESAALTDTDKVADVASRLGNAGIPRDTTFISRRLSDRDVLIEGGLWKRALKESWGAKQVEKQATDVRILNGKTAPKTITDANTRVHLTAASVGAELGDVELARVSTDGDKTTWRLEVTVTVPTTVPSDILSRWLSGVLDPRSLVG